MAHRPVLSMTFALAVTLAATAPSRTFARASTVPVRGFLCDTADHAMRFADARAGGESEEIAKDRVGRVAKAEVCGRYIGLAVIESEQVKLDGGTAYKLTAYRFRGDHRIAWLAERTFAPTVSNWDL